jgi:hypothetical protein
MPFDPNKLAAVKAAKAQTAAPASGFDPAKLAARRAERAAAQETAQEPSIARSAIGNIWDGVKMIAAAPLNLFRLGKQTGEAIGSAVTGNLEPAKQLGSGLVMPTIERAKAVARPIMEQGFGGIPEAAEVVARKPFDYAMDASMVAQGLGAAGVKGASNVGMAIDPGRRMVQGGAYVLGKGMELAPEAAKMGASLLFGPSREAISARIRDPRMANAPDYFQLSQQLPDTFNKLDDHIGKLDTKAWETLSNSADPAKGAFGAADLLGAIKEVRRTLGDVIGPADKRAVMVLDSISEDIGNLYQKRAPGRPTGILDANGNPMMTEPVATNGFMPEAKVKELIQKMDANINWDNLEAGTANAKLMALRTELDGLLKNQNPAYESAMRPVDYAMRTRIESARVLNMQKTAGEQGGWKPSPNTVSSLQNLYGGKAQRQQAVQTVIQALDKETGSNVAGNTRNARLANEFELSETNGSRRTNLGGAMAGGMAGGMIGLATGDIGVGIGAGGMAGAMGAAAGYALDKAGGQILGSGIDKVAPGLRLAEDAMKATGRTVSGVPITYAGAYSKAAFLSNQEQKQADLLEKYYRSQK